MSNTDIYEREGVDRETVEAVKYSEKFGCPEQNPDVLNLMTHDHPYILVNTIIRNSISYLVYH